MLLYSALNGASTVNKSKQFLIKCDWLYLPFLRMDGGWKFKQMTCSITRWQGPSTQWNSECIKLKGSVQRTSVQWIIHPNCLVLGLFTHRDLCTPFSWSRHEACEASCGSKNASRWRFALAEPGGEPLSEPAATWHRFGFSDNDIYQRILYYICYKCGGVIPVCCWMLHTQCVLSRHALRQVAPTLQMHVPIEGKFYTVMPSINASLDFKFWHLSNLAEITIIMIGCDNVIEAVIWLIDLQPLTLQQCQPICIWAELEINLSLACLVSSSSLGARTVSLN